MKRFVTVVDFLVLIILAAVGVFASEQPAVFEKPYAPKLALVMLNGDANPKVTATLLTAHRLFFASRGYEVVADEAVSKARQKLGIELRNPMPIKEIWALGRELDAQNIIAFRGKIKDRHVWVNLVPKSKSRVTFDSLIMGTEELDLICELEKRSADSSSQSGSLLQDFAGLTAFFPISGGITLATDGGFSKQETKALDRAMAQAYGRFLERQITLQKMLGPREDRFF